MSEDEKYIGRCLELAQKGRCRTAPNPMVGAVIVAEGRIIGEGYHAICGQGHAEVNAIKSVKPADGHLLTKATIYVSLEPCSHYGKTPPCADLIVEKQIPRIVVGCQDPFSKVAGRGIAKLREAGREVVVGVREAECRHLIRRFITFHTLHRPFITLKWAQSRDAFIDGRTGQTGEPTYFSTPETQMLVHKLRAEHSAILVGSRSALLDNPSLNVRCWSGPQPLRIVLGHQTDLPADLRLFDGSQPTLHWKEPVSALLEELYNRGIQSLLVEGGAQVLQSFIDANLWDEAQVEIAPFTLGQGTSAPTMGKHVSYESHTRFGHTFLAYESTRV